MNVKPILDARLKESLGALQPSAHDQVSHAGAYALMVLVKRHVAKYARVHHDTANKLGAMPTGHIEKGAAAITCTGDEVAIPIPGFQRVFHPLTIEPRRANALTIPINPVSYGKRAGRLASEGWHIFRLGKSRDGVLMGALGDEEPIALYKLARKTRVKQDRTMLPTDEEMERAAAQGAFRALMRRRPA